MPLTSRWHLKVHGLYELPFRVEVAANATFRDIRWNYNTLFEIYNPANGNQPEYADLKPQLRELFDALNNAYRRMTAKFGKDMVIVKGGD